jgi:hypothetical protein
MGLSFDGRNFQSGHGPAGLVRSAEPPRTLSGTIIFTRIITTLTRKALKTNFRICGTDGTPFTVGQLCALADAQRTKIIPEIGYLLQIKAVIVKLRVEGMVRSGEKGSRIWVPRSHFPVFTCKEYSTDGDISNEIFSKVWKGVVLFKGVDTIGNPKYKIMLVEFHGGIAERVGTVELTPRDYECLPKTKKRRSIWLQ